MTGASGAEQGVLQETSFWSAVAASGRVRWQVTGRAFLYATAVRVSANIRRSQRRRREVGEPPPEAASAEPRGPERMAELSRARVLLDTLLDQMPDELRRVLILAEIEQLEATQIAELEQIPVGTANSRLRRARAHFRELLAKRGSLNPFGSSV